MLVLLSPAKNQDFDTPVPVKDSTQPTFQSEAAKLVDCLRQYDAKALAKLMSISPKLAELNVGRFAQFDPKHYGLDNAKQALFAFRGL